MNKIKRFVVSLILALIPILSISTPAQAIANPDTIAFGTGATSTYQVFYNVKETGDWLVNAEGYVYYVVTPTDYTASEAFNFALLNEAGNVTLASTVLQEYGDRPISIYLTAAQVTALGLVVGNAYCIRISGNPLIFGTGTGNTVEACFGTEDYTDQLLGNDGGVPTSNNLRNFCLVMAEHIEAEDAPVTPYIVTVQGYRYLTSTGGNIFLEGIPALDQLCPILFQNSLENMQGDTPSSTGAYATALSPLNQWGAQTANGLTMIGTYLGINQALAGSLVLFILVALLAFWFYKKTESGTAVLLLVGATPFLGAWMGLMPLALAFIFTIVIVVLMSYFFFSRGAL